MNSLPGVALNCDPPDLCLLSSWDYIGEPLAAGKSEGFLFVCFVFLQKYHTSHSVLKLIC
jgi:hypothetical protein